jgi:AcrR family transcriptional regulator
MESVFREMEPGRKGEILDAATEVFAEKGYSAGSMREIAARVGVSEPALYRHFPGKEAIFRTIVAIMATRLRKEAVELVGAIEPETVRAQLVGVFSDRRRAVVRLAPVMRTVIASSAFNETLLDDFRTKFIFPVREMLAEKAAEMDACFGVPDAEATRDARVRAMIALFVGYIVSSFVLQDSPDEVVADAALRVMGWTAR